MEHNGMLIIGFGEGFRAGHELAHPSQLFELANVVNLIQPMAFLSDLSHYPDMLAEDVEFPAILPGEGLHLGKMHQLIANTPRQKSGM